MRFLVDNCAGRSIADWLREAGHDVVFVGDDGPDPGDAAILRRAVDEGRIVVTMDKDYGELIYRDRLSHAGLIRLPHGPTNERLGYIREVLARHEDELVGAVVTVAGSRIRLTPRAGRGGDEDPG